MRKRKEERKERKDRQKEKVRERKGKGKRVNKLWETSFFLFYLLFYLCVLLGKEQPYIFEPKKLKISFSNPQKTMFIVVWDKKTKTDSPQKQ